MNVYELYGEELHYKGRFLGVDKKAVYYADPRDGFVRKLVLAYARILDKTVPVICLYEGQ